MRITTSRVEATGLLCLVLLAIAWCLGGPSASAATTTPSVRSGTECAYANALKAVGERQTAHAQYLKVLAAEPQSPCALSGAKATAPETSTSAWDWLTDAAKHAGVAVGFVVLVSLLVVTVALVLLQPVMRWKRTRDHWPAKLFRRPSLSVDDFNDSALTSKLGPGVAGLVRGRVSWERDRFGLHVVSGQAGIASAWAGLGDVSADAKAAVAVIQFLTALLPRRNFVLKGQLQPDGNKGAGISLELSQGDAAKALVSFWANDLDAPAAGGTQTPPGEPGSQDGGNGKPTDPYQQLAIASAAWTDHWVSTLVGGDALLSRDPLSWAYFRAGVDCQQAGELAAATTLYERALRSDGQNAGALANLGIISFWTARYGDAEWYLKRALAVLDARPDGKLSTEHNPDWYRIKYTLAALHTNWAASLSDPEGRRAHTQESAELAKELASQTLATLDDIPQRTAEKSARTFQENTLKPFLEGTIEPSALVLAASTAVDEADLEPNGPQPRALHAPVAHDNGTGRVSPGEPAKSLPDTTLDTKKAEARKALAASRVDPWPLISFVEEAPSRPPAALFNLACFYTRVRDFVTAADRLILALREESPTERKGLIEAATTDPTLAPLRTRRPGLIPKLQQFLDPVEDAAALVHQFDLQSQAYHRFASQGWEMKWLDNVSGFDWSASKNAQTRFVEIAGAAPLTTADIERRVGQLAIYGRSGQAGAAGTRRVLVVPADTKLTRGVLDGAANVGLDVEDPTGPLKATPDARQPVPAAG